MKVLVTGGAGFIGSHIAERLLKTGHSVRVLDNYVTGAKANLAPFLDRVDLIEGDIRKASDCRTSCQGMDAVFHQAAAVSVPRSVESPRDSHETNIGGTLNMLMAAKEAGCRRFVYASSSSAYGNLPESPKRESMSPQPLSPYAVQKLTGEMYCRAFFECYGLQTIALRYFNVFGPRQDPDGPYAAAIPAFVRAAMTGKSPIVYGDGEQTRDFTYIDNVVDANMAALETKQAGGEVVNVACGIGISINTVLREIQRILGTPTSARYEPARLGDVKHSTADISRARDLLGYSPRVTFEEGLRRAMEYYRSRST